MVDFGPNGTVYYAGTNPARDYAAGDEKPRIKRVALACFLCGICACICVALIAAMLAFVFSTLTSLAGAQPAQFAERGGFMMGAFVAVMMAAFNWYLFFIVIPVTWLVLALSIGRFPRRGITRPAPYYRWGAIWGALLVGGTTGFFGASMQQDGFFGALLTGGLIGALAGLVCASLFLAIVRPKQQISDLATDVF
ncbi:MAG: hypothetical protein RIB03_01040 [Henriciella sp.]|uniref:hypothetical protein n=1 Tax=Henriciella sp. TaxID=1968823 RepID=UPI0032EF54E4